MAYHSWNWSSLQINTLSQSYVCNSNHFFNNSSHACCKIWVRHAKRKKTQQKKNKQTNKRKINEQSTESLKKEEWYVEPSGYMGQMLKGIKGMLTGVQTGFSGFSNLLNWMTNYRRWKVWNKHWFCANSQLWQKQKMQDINI